METKEFKQAEDLKEFTDSVEKELIDKFGSATFEETATEVIKRITSLVLKGKVKIDSKLVFLYITCPMFHKKRRNEGDEMEKISFLDFMSYVDKLGLPNSMRLKVIILVGEIDIVSSIHEDFDKQLFYHMFKETIFPEIMKEEMEGETKPKDKRPVVKPKEKPEIRLEKLILLLNVDDDLPEEEIKEFVNSLPSGINHILSDVCPLTITEYMGYIQTKIFSYSNIPLGEQSNIAIIVSAILNEACDKKDFDSDGFISILDKTLKIFHGKINCMEEPVVTKSEEIKENIKPTEKEHDKKSELKNITNELKESAKYSDIPIITAQHLNQSAVADVDLVKSKLERLYASIEEYVYTIVDTELYDDEFLEYFDYIIARVLNIVDSDIESFVSRVLPKKMKPEYQTLYNNFRLEKADGNEYNRFLLLSDSEKELLIHRIIIYTLNDFLLHVYNSESEVIDKHTYQCYIEDTKFDSFSKSLFYSEFFEKVASLLEDEEFIDKLKNNKKSLYLKEKDVVHKMMDHLMLEAYIHGFTKEDELTGTDIDLINSLLNNLIKIINPATASTGSKSIDEFTIYKILSPAGRDKAIVMIMEKFCDSINKFFHENIICNGCYFARYIKSMPDGLLISPFFSLFVDYFDSVIHNKTKLDRVLTSVQIRLTTEDCDHVWMREVLDDKIEDME